MRDTVINKKQIQLSDMYIQMCVLEDQLKDKKKLSQYKSYVKKLPKMIRKNGLILTLSFLNKKSGGVKKVDEISNDKELYIHIVGVYIGFLNRINKNYDTIDKILSYFLCMDNDLTKKIRELLKKEADQKKLSKKDNRKNEVKKLENEIKKLNNEILLLEKKREESIKLKEKDLKSITLKTIKFFETYSIIVDGFVSDDNE